MDDSPSESPTIDSDARRARRSRGSNQPQPKGRGRQRCDEIEAMLATNIVQAEADRIDIIDAHCARLMSFVHSDEELARLMAFMQAEVASRE